MSTRVPFRGVLLDQPSIDAFLTAEKLTGWELPIMQGSWSSGTAASAGTHDGGGAIDVGLRDPSGNLRSGWEQMWTVRNLRRAGFRAWRRTPGQGFAYHVHGILAGDPLVSSAAAKQLVQWDDHQNGLADHGADNDTIDVAAGRPAVLPRGAAVPRTMYDAVTPSNIPPGAMMVAGYVDGDYANMGAMAARFPHAIRVGIAARASTNAGTVLDVEKGDATPAQAPGWVQMRRAAGVDPTVYCNSSTWPAVKAAFAAAGVRPPHYWIAKYDGNPAIPAGAVAKQYSNPGPFDLSAVADVWPGIDKGVDMAVTDQEKADIAALAARAVNGSAITEGVPRSNTTRSRDAVESRTEATTGRIEDKVDSALASMASALAGLADLEAKVSSLVTTGLTPDQVAAIAKAVNDDAAARMEQ